MKLVNFLFHFSKDDAAIVEDIVNGISTKFALMLPIDPSDVVGMIPHMERLDSMLTIQLQKEVRMIGIWGMGGIGKTTIAKYLSNQYFERFSAHCFIEEVWKISKTYGLGGLQEKFVSYILPTEYVGSLPLNTDATILSLGLDIEECLLYLTVWTTWIRYELWQKRLAYLAYEAESSQPQKTEACSELVALRKETCMRLVAWKATILSSCLNGLLLKEELHLLICMNNSQFRLLSLLMVFPLPLKLSACVFVERPR